MNDTIGTREINDSTLGTWNKTDRGIFQNPRRTQFQQEGQNNLAGRVSPARSVTEGYANNKINIDRRYRKCCICHELVPGI